MKTKGGMMSNSQMTIASIFSSRDKGMARIEPKKLEGAASLSALKHSCQEKAGDNRWPAALEEVVKKVDHLLDVPLGAVISSAWNKYSLLKNYSNPEKYSPSESFLVPLAEHTIVSRHEPYVDILVGEHHIGRIDFVINISLTLKGSIARVQDGKLKEIRVGDCKAKGTVSYGDVILLEKESDSLELPGSIDLGEGIPVSVTEAARNKDNRAT
jgi:hypothetical protein